MVVRSGFDLGLFDGLGIRGRMSTREWAERNRVVKGGPIADRDPSGKIPWRTNETPHAAGIMDAVDDPRYDIVSVQGPTRLAKTEAAIINPIMRDLCMGLPVLYVNATAADCVKFWQDKLLPAIQATQVLHGFERGAKDGGQMLHRIFRNGAILYMVGAGMIPTGFDAPRCYCDEVNKPGYRMKKGDEVNSISLARERGSGYGRGRKLVLVCTVTTMDGEITKQFGHGDQRLYYVPCPFCGEYQVMEFAREHASVSDGQRFPDWDYPHGWLTYDSASTMKARKTTRYICGLCKREIAEDKKTWMVTAGLWIRRGCKVNVSAVKSGGFSPCVKSCPLPKRFFPSETGEPERDTIRASFHFNSMISRIVPWGELASEWLDAQEAGDPDAMKSFQRSRLAIPWEDRDLLDRRAWDATFIRSHSTPYYSRTLPADCPATVITMGADVHGAAVYYVFRAWAPDATSWLLEAGVSEVLRVDKRADESARGAAVMNALDRLWEAFAAGFNVGTKEEPKILAVSRGFLDEGWEQAIVRAACLRDGGASPRRGVWIPVKGVGGMAKLWMEKQKDYSFALNLSVDRLKHVLSRLMAMHRRTEGDKMIVDPGYWHLHSDPDHNYCHHMCSEEWRPKKNKKGTDSDEWEWGVRHANNHWWDCEIYALAAAISCGIHAHKTVANIMTQAAGPQPDRQGSIGEPRRVTAADYGDKKKWVVGRGDESRGAGREKGGNRGWRIGR